MYTVRVGSTTNAREVIAAPTESIRNIWEGVFGTAPSEGALYYVNGQVVRNIDTAIGDFELPTENTVFLSKVVKTDGGR